MTSYINLNESKFIDYHKFSAQYPIFYITLTNSMSKSMFTSSVKIELNNSLSLIITNDYSIYGNIEHDNAMKV